LNILSWRYLRKRRCKKRLWFCFEAGLKSFKWEVTHLNLKKKKTLTFKGWGTLRGVWTDFVSVL
jgi:hypothetical protein